MVTLVVRVWLPDRPGALGRVASHIGSVGGDVVGIEILERGAGRAIDELVVDLPGEHLVDLLLAQIAEVEGVAVEDIRPLRGPVHDRWLDPLDTATRVIEADDPERVLGVLCDEMAIEMDADWAVALDPRDGSLHRAAGEPPDVRWIHAFVEGSKLSAAVASGSAGPEDVAWASLPGAHREVVLGRRGRPFRSRERRQLAALARIAAVRLRELGAADATTGCQAG